MCMRKALFALILIPVFALVILCLALVLGGPSRPRPLTSISAPFKFVDFTWLPALKTFQARDGSPLAYRLYVGNKNPLQGSVVLVHGSSASSKSMHVLAMAFREAGYNAYALDIRGHGASGRPGHIDYVGQLEDDLEDFMQRVHPAAPVTLVGFSSGGGFALRVAGSKRQNLFASYLLLSPFISQDAATYRPNSGGWVSVGVPRLVVLSAMNAIGVTVLNDLPVTRFATDEGNKAGLTTQYGYALAQNFRPLSDFVGNIRAVNRPMQVIAGQADEVFDSSHFAEVFRQAGKDVSVKLLPGIGHIALTLNSEAVNAAVQAVHNMSEPAAPRYASETVGRAY